MEVLSKKNVFGTKIISVMLAILTVIAILGFQGTVKASAIDNCNRITVTGCFNSGTAYTSGLYVYTGGTNAKLRICTFSQNGERTNGKITVKAVSDNGATYRWDVTGCNGVFDSTTNISLPNGNTRYKVFVARTNGDNDNITKCCYWSMDFNSGCWH